MVALVNVIAHIYIMDFPKMILIRAHPHFSKSQHVAIALQFYFDRIQFLFGIVLNDNVIILVQGSRESPAQLEYKRWS